MDKKTVKQRVDEFLNKGNGAGELMLMDMN